MRALPRVVAGAGILFFLLAFSQSNASAASASLRIEPSHGPKYAIFQWTYRLTPACRNVDLTLTWDDQYVLGTVPQDCSAFEEAQGALTPTAQANNAGVHKLCVGNPDAGAPIACASLTIDLVPGSCEAQGLMAPECVDTPVPYHGDCIPNTQQSSPPCVTTTPIPIVCDTTGAGPSPPCAETPVPPQTETPIVPTETPVDESTSTPTSAASSTPTMTRTPTPTVLPVCDATASPGAGGCATATPTSGADNGGSDVSVNWTAVVVAVGVVAATGGAAAGGWVFLKRG
jgi:hypothetical protein